MDVNALQALWNGIKEIEPQTRMARRRLEGYAFKNYDGFNQDRHDTFTLLVEAFKFYEKLGFIEDHPVVKNSYRLTSIGESNINQLDFNSWWKDYLKDQQSQKKLEEKKRQNSYEREELELQKLRFEIKDYKTTKYLAWAAAGLAFISFIWQVVESIFLALAT